ncbi:MAG: GNAT family N-acetyltransferase [Sedimentisphaerales bacterium]|nr:GNAT family N-acetyltransferase [Sedimentisphaerales bacterium]
MYDIRIINDLEQCRDIWDRTIPQETVWDIWEFRACFQKHFQRPACFITAENSGGPVEILPLSWIEESQRYGYFPGETWQDKTWLEQNRIPSDNAILCNMLDSCPGPYYLRYLLPSSGPVPQNNCVVDEIGYLFRPADYDYDIENYFQQFSKKSAKNIKREIASLQARACFRYDDISDFEHLIQLNVNNFGDSSYFYDRRFRESFREIMHYLNEKGWLNIITVIINSEIAAVDIGCVHQGDYTLLGGGTNRNYPGVAKLINLHHMQRGCREKFNLLDFLCGDFSWKQKFHLTARPLYLLSNCSSENHFSENMELRGAEYVE